MKRLFAVLFTLFAFSQFGAAQMAQTFLLNQSNRQGTHTSASFDVPTNMPNFSVLLKANIPTNDLTDTQNSLTLSIEEYDSANGIWKVIAGLTWNGGPLPPPRFDPQPGMGFNIDQLAGKTVRIVLSIPRTMRIGATVEIK